MRKVYDDNDGDGQWINFDQKNSLEPSVQLSYIVRKSAAMRVAHCCKRFPFFFRLIRESTEKKIGCIPVPYIKITLHFKKENNHSNPFNAGEFQTFNIIEINMRS